MSRSKPIDGPDSRPESYLGHSAPVSCRTSGADTRPASGRAPSQGTAALGAFLGHLFPVWLGFRGGKGVATYIGVLLAASWPTGLAFCGLWLTTAIVTRYSSLSALLASFLAPIILAVRGEIQFAEVFGVLTALLWFKHGANIARLLNGTESRIGKK